jgi:long-chain acyl-CoA synthetase
MTTYNLADLLNESAERFPGRAALVLGDTRLTYAELGAMSNQVANLLIARGIRPGDRVALSCVNVPYFTVVYFGILKAGATVVPLNVLLRSREIAYHLRDSGAKAYFCFEGTPELPIGAEGYAGFKQARADGAGAAELFFSITASPSAPSAIHGADGPVETLGHAVREHSSSHPTVPANEDDIAVILYTSGTTGQPKGAELRHRNMRDNALAGAHLFAASAERPDTYLCVLPLFHSFGQTVIQNGALAFGGTIVMLPRFEAGQALRLMAEHEVTFFAGVPTMYWALLGALGDSGVDVAQLAARMRVAVSGGSALPVEIHGAFARQFGITIIEGYGLSETSPVAALSHFGEPARPGSIGTPIPGVEMKLISPLPGQWDEITGPDALGEIAIKGHNVMKGYHGRPDATAEVIRDGWFRSGDLARRDADGWYYIVDRTKDLVIRGGYNVYPREIEEVLITHPAVSLAAVIGVPHQSLGQEVKAFVILKKDAEVTPGDLIAWSREQMAAYKYPRIVEIVDELPMTATGKILKRQLS